MKIYLLLALAFTSMAHSQGVVTLDFSGFTLPFYNLTEAVPNGYGGLQWSNFYVINPANSFQGPYGSGFQNIASSGNVIWNANGASAQISRTVPFDLYSAWFTADWMDGLQIMALGYRDGILTYNTAFVINTTSPTLISLNYQNVDQVTFTASGGIQNPLYSGYGPEFALDNLTVNVPEPSDVTLMMGGIAGLGTVSILRKCQTSRPRDGKASTSS